MVLTRSVTARAGVSSVFSFSFFSDGAQRARKTYATVTARGTTAGRAARSERMARREAILYENGGRVVDDDDELDGVELPELAGVRGRTGACSGTAEVPPHHTTNHPMPPQAGSPPRAVKRGHSTSCSDHSQPGRTATYSEGELKCRNTRTWHQTTWLSRSVTVHLNVPTNSR